jgi:hypothetical protein
VLDGTTIREFLRAACQKLVNVIELTVATSIVLGYSAHS